MRHKHADLIHAWAEGAEIEYKPVDVSIWKDCGDLEPSWGNDFFEYRIKPEKKPDVVRWACISPSYGASDPKEIVGKPQIKLTFNGDTDELIKAEVL